MVSTEKLIIDGAILVWNADPSATMEKVAAQVGVTSRTLYRYFNDRNKLIEACYEMLSATCREAFAAAFSAQYEPLKQLELSLYAGIDCGSKYAFFNKLNKTLPQPQGPNAIHEQWLAVVQKLQYEAQISNVLSIAWIHKLFTGMVNVTIDALNSGDVAPNDVKRFAWLSFSRSIGIGVPSALAEG